ncbi:MAG: tetratricopeptide repeat protein, partial [Deltaproteobacteria bacterium]|nr:tetratricopeptide repeat protein [Deltaproteobacteria bacterium]
MKTFMSNIGFYPLKSRCLQYLPAIFLICFVAAAIYINTFDAPFVFDDQPTIGENAKIRNPGNFLSPDVLRSPRPFVDFTFALNYHYGKLRVFGYHLVNLFIHIANGILVFFLSRRLFQKLSGTDNPDSYLAALFAALIFISHPLQTQAVTYIAQRYTSMAAFFYLGSVLSYIIARDAKSTGKPVACSGFFLLTAFCGVLAFLSKQISASLPLAILLVEYVVYDQTWQGWKKKIGFVLPGFLLCGFFYAYSMGMFRHDIQFGTLLEDISEKARETQAVGRWRYLCTQFNVIAIYVRLLFIPVQQNVDYVYPFKNGFFDGATPYSFIFLIGILGAAGWSRKKHAILFLGILWFFITLSVESSIFPIRDALFEHRLYLPMFGFSIIGASFMERLLSKHRLWAQTAMLVILISLCLLTYNRNKVWRDDVALWSDVVQKNPSNYRGFTNLGNALMDRGDWKGALARYDSVLRLRPDNYIALYNKGVLLERTGKSEEAVSLFQETLRIRPDYSKAMVNLGV